MTITSQTYTSLAKGFVFTVILFSILQAVGFIKINPNYLIENVLICSFWWILLSFLIHNVGYLQKDKTLIYRVLGLISLLVIIFISESVFGIQDNPISISLLIVFWMGVAYLVMPRFFNKYRVPILLVYSLVLAYFLFFRMDNDYLESHHQRVINLLLLPIPLFITLWIYEQWKWLKNLKSEKNKAEINLLKNQINPHFFFNTLNNLYGLTVEKSDLAPDVVLKLSEMMRYTIYQGKEEYVTLQQEIDYLYNFIELHKMRYENQVDIKLSHDFDKNYEIAPLLFIILVENAFKHGLEKKAEGGYIHITLKANSGVIQFNVENNFDEIKDYSAEGIGLNNLKKRLEYIYPQRHQLDLVKSLSVFNASLTLEIE